MELTERQTTRAINSINDSIRKLRSSLGNDAMAFSADEKKQMADEIGELEDVREQISLNSNKKYTVCQIGNMCGVSQRYIFHVNGKNASDASEDANRQRKELGIGRSKESVTAEFIFENHLQLLEK